MKEDPYAKEYYDRKVLEQECSKYEDRIIEIQKLLSNKSSDPSHREKLTEALQFLQKAESQYENLLTNTSHFICKMSLKMQDDTAQWVQTNMNTYDQYERQIQRRIDLFD
mmetsp:Transcript_9111/g.8030  ORF Transcript_9111/g.8030 Transcript_9111/m.8030 type:complete len:110 (-) Transcript_9111:48-377(-)